MKNESCPVCGAAVPAAGELPECGGCGLVFQAERRFAAPSYAPGIEEEIYGSAKAALFREALDFLDRALPARGRLLDVGCAGGEFLRAAAARGWEVEGVEIEPALAVKALAHGFEVYPKPVEEAGLKGGAYGAVAVFEVFSQMEKPAAAAAELLRIMEPGGAVYIREFNAAFHLLLFHLDRTGLFRLLGARPYIIHNLNFKAKTLRFLLEKAGFRAIRIRNSRPTSGDPYRTGGPLGKFLTGALKVLYYGLAQALWCLTLGRFYAGSALIVTARK